MKGQGRGASGGLPWCRSCRRRRARLGADVSPDVLKRLKVTVDKVNWFSTYKVHHRVADHFRVGRAFLLGASATPRNIHSPVGGQGMNTGIGDAINLAWKLAAVLKGAAPARMLDSYNDERIAFARKLVATTDQVFTVASDPSQLAQFGRLEVLPFVMPIAFNLKAVRQFLWRTVSQIGVNYHGGMLSAGGAGYVRGGDRLAWIKPTRRGAKDNFASLDGLDWQVHVYGEAKPALKDICGRRGLKLYVFPWREAAQAAGFMRNAAYLVRPDGYVGLADPQASAANLALVFCGSRGSACARRGSKAQATARGRSGVRRVA